MIALKSSLHIITLLTSFLAYIIIVTTKGFFSAWIAQFMGDSTAEKEGYLSWNPLVHIDIVGALCLLLLGFGWGKTTPIEHRNISNRAKLTFAYLAGTLIYMIIGILALIFLLKIFGFKILDVAKQDSSVRFISLSQLSAAYPKYSSTLLASGLVIVDMMYFSVALAAIYGILQGFRLFLIVFFPEIFYKPEADLLIFFIPFLLLMLFFERFATFIGSIVFSFGTLLGHILGASY